jgi:hypothetical protein
MRHASGIESGSISAHPRLLARTVSQQVSWRLAINRIKFRRLMRDVLCPGLLWLDNRLFRNAVPESIRIGGVPNPMPAADVDVTAELVRRLLAGQHQDLAGRPVEFLANGWDNAMFRLGDDLLVRLPRREVDPRPRPGAQPRDRLPRPLRRQPQLLNVGRRTLHRVLGYARPPLSTHRH